MHYSQKFGENPSMVTTDIAVTTSQTDGRTDGRTDAHADGRHKNIMPPAPSNDGRGIKTTVQLMGSIYCIIIFGYLLTALQYTNKLKIVTD